MKDKDLYRLLDNPNLKKIVLELKTRRDKIFELNNKQERLIREIINEYDYSFDDLRSDLLLYATEVQNGADELIFEEEIRKNAKALFKRFDEDYKNIDIYEKLDEAQKKKRDKLLKNIFRDDYDGYDDYR